MHRTDQALRLISREVIQQMAALIAQNFHPEKIILFGSYARGEATVNSDVDLMVIMKNPSPRPDRAVPIIRLIHEHINEPLDIIVRSPEGFDAWSQSPFSLSNQVIKEGKVLYEKPRE